MSTAEPRPTEPRKEHLVPLQTIVALYKSAWRYGRRPTIDEYLPDDIPELRRFLLADLARAELRLRLAAGEPARAVEYVERYPELMDDPAAARRLAALEAKPPARAAESDGPAAPPEPGACAVALEVLSLIDGLYSGARFEFDRHATFLIGRDKKAHLRLLNDPRCSRNHCLLEFQPPRCYLRDLGSNNGTFVNGTRVDEAFLEDGDVVSCGRSRLRFSIARRPALPADGEAICRGCGIRVGFSGLPDLVEAPAAAAFLCETCRETVRREPRSVPGYEILHPLGRARLGRLDLARHAGTGQPVALRRLVPPLPVGEPTLERFLRDVRALRRLEHPRLARLLDCGQADGQFYFASEYVEGADLTQLLLDQSRRAAVRMVCGIVCQALEGLHQAHERGLVHGDVKPSNLLVRRDGTKLSTRLADCGLRRLCEGAGLAGLTRTGGDRPALPFMAPEAVRDCRNARPAADVYGAGATLYYLLAGAPPHLFPLDRDPYTVILEDEILPLGKRCPDLPPGLVEIVHRALQRKPRLRFASAAEMFHALLPYTRGRKRQR
jgi:serine/threonine-protein kinase